MSSTSKSVIVQGPWSSSDINSPQKTIADTSLSREHKREARLFAQRAEADRLKAALAVAAAAEAFVRSINEMVPALAVMQARPTLYGFRRIEGGKGRSFLPHRFDADGSLVYRRARHTLALALFTSPERRALVETLKAYPSAAQGRAVGKARELFAREMRVAARRDREAQS
jgi:hypothetical protein